MLQKLLNKLENPAIPLLGPNVKALKFWGLLLPKKTFKRKLYMTMHILVTIFTLTECVDVWFVKSDISLLLINLKITMLATVSVFKVLSFLIYQKKWKKIISYVTTADLNQRNTKSKENKTIIDNFTKYCRKITYLYWFLMYTTVLIVIFQPILKFVSSPVYRANVKNGTDSYLPVVSSWVPFNKNTIPGYLAASLYQTYAAIYGGGWITSFDTNAMVIMVFFRGELELIRLDAAKIFGDDKLPVTDDEAMETLKRFHRRYNQVVKHVKMFDSCLSPVMLFYMIVCSVMLCVTAYQITTETNAMQRFLVAEYLVFGIAQLFIYCWHSNDVLYASTNVMRGPYESRWWNRNNKMRRHLFLLIGQFKKDIVLTAGPISALNVATFLSIVKGAYSYYTILSQSESKKASNYQHL